MAKKNYLKKIAVSKGDGTVDDVVIVTPEALVDVVQAANTRAKSIDGAVSVLNDKIDEVINDRIYAVRPDSSKQLAEDGTIFYVDCADLGEGKPVSEVYEQENPVVKDLCGNFEDTTNVALSSGSIHSSSLGLVSGKQELKVPTDLFIFFGADSGEAVFSLDWEQDSSIGAFILNQKITIYATVTDETENQLLGYTTTIPTSGFHHYAIVVCWVALAEGEAEAVKIYVDGEPLTSNFNLLGVSTMNSGTIHWLMDASSVAMQNITYAKVVEVSGGSDGSVYWETNFDDNHTIDSITFDDTKLIEYQKKKMAHSDYSKYYTTKEALVKLMDSLNYDLEVGGSLDVSLGGLVWTNGDNVTPANNASTTLSNVKITKATIEEAEIKSSNISESEIDSTTTIQDRTYDGGTYDSNGETYDGGSF